MHYQWFTMHDAAIRYLDSYFQQNPGEETRLEQENRGKEISNEEFHRQYERLTAEANERSCRPEYTTLKSTP